MRLAVIYVSLMVDLCITLRVLTRWRFLDANNSKTRAHKWRWNWLISRFTFVLAHAGGERGVRVCVRIAHLNWIKISLAQMNESTDFIHRRCVPCHLPHFIRVANTFAGFLLLVRPIRMCLCIVCVRGTLFFYPSRLRQIFVGCANREREQQQQKKHPVQDTVSAFGSNAASAAAAAK